MTDEIHHPYGKPKTDDELIEDEVIEQAKRIWGRPYSEKERPYLDLPYVHCTECGPYDVKRPCVCSVVEGTALCAQHWIKKRVQELKELRKEALKPKEPFPVAELKYGGLVPVETGSRTLIMATHRIPLDLDEFCRL